MSELKGWRELPLGTVPLKFSTEFKTGDWRTFKPVIDESKCIKCMLCWIYCPEPSILWDGVRISIDYRYCKGCGICARECPVNAIRMVPEG